MSYWLGVPYWNQGYGTEAVNAVLAYEFNQWHLHRIYAPHFLNNPASGRVLQKVGMTYEGRMREHYQPRWARIHRVAPAHDLTRESVFWSE